MVCLRSLLYQTAPLVAAVATQPDDLHFKPFPMAPYPSPAPPVTETWTVTETVTGGALTITAPAPPCPPGQTVYQTVYVSPQAVTVTDTQYTPVYITNTETSTVTQLTYNTMYQQLTQTVSYTDVQVATITLTQTSTVTEAQVVPTTETVYIPTTITVNTCNCPTMTPCTCYTPPCVIRTTTVSPPSPFPCGPRPPPCSPQPPRSCCDSCNEPSCDGCCCDRTPIPVKLHRKLLNKARKFINSDACEITGKDWKTPNQAHRDFRKKFPKEKAPCFDEKVPLKDVCDCPPNAPPRSKCKKCN